MPIIVTPSTISNDITKGLISYWEDGFRIYSMTMVGGPNAFDSDNPRSSYSCQTKILEFLMSTVSFEWWISAAKIILNYGLTSENDLSNDISATLMMI